MPCIPLKSPHNPPSYPLTSLPSVPTSLKIPNFITISSILEMGPDLTRAYFWPTVNKRPTRLRPGYFPTRPEEEIFFDPKGKNLTFLGEIFEIQNPNHKWLTWPDPSHKKLTQPNPGQKFLTRTHYYSILLTLHVLFICKTLFLILLFIEPILGTCVQ